MRRALAVVAAFIAWFLLGSPLAADAGAALPVPYTFIPTVAQGGAPGANAPGTNDWTCKPTAAHPRPVVLVHGTAGNQATNWQTYGPLLKNAGYCVFALTYGVTPGATYPLTEFGGMTPMEQSAQQLANFVTKVKQATGARQVDLIGHSQGTVIPEYWVKFLGGAASVDHYISLGALWHGTQSSSLFGLVANAFGVPASQAPLCQACVEFAPDSPFYRTLRATPVAVPGIQYTNIQSRYDELVLPYTSGFDAGMRNITIQDVCPLDTTEHFALAADHNIAQIVLNTLDPAHAKPITCYLVAPFVGGA